MRYAVLLTQDAARDLAELHACITRQEGAAGADHVLDEIGKLFERLERFPNRGPHPEELLSLGIREYRQVFFKPYRLIYRVIEDRVYVLLVADGRRDMQTLLQRRLLHG